MEIWLKFVWVIFCNLLKIEIPAEIEISITLAIQQAEIHKYTQGQKVGIFQLKMYCK